MIYWYNVVERMPEQDEIILLWYEDSPITGRRSGNEYVLSDGKNIIAKHIQWWSKINPPTIKTVLHQGTYIRVYNGEGIEWLKKEGYKQISRKSGTVARCDVSDQHLRNIFGEIEIREEERDHYRRCFSTDQIRNVPKEVMKELETAR